MVGKVKLSTAFDRIIDSTLTAYIILGIIFMGLLSPLVLMFLTAFKSPAEAQLWPPTTFPHHPDLKAFADVLFHSNVPTAIKSSLIIGLSTVAIVVFASMTTAYGLSQFKYRGSKILSFSLLATRIIPPISLTIPFFVIFAYLHLINSRWTLIILNTYLNYPIVTWLLINAFNGFPEEFMDAARVDGASRTQTFYYVVLPLTVPAIAAGAIITFLFTWNEFLYALTFTQTAATMPLTVGIFEFVGDEAIEWTRLCAVGVFASLPSIIFFLFAQRHIVQGLTAGAIKGAA